MAAKYPPYVNAYGNIPNLFDAIKQASVPPKFTNNFMQTALGLKSTSYRAMIPLLKRLGFIDPGNVPTQAYRDFRDDKLSGSVMAERLRAAYGDLFDANEYAYKLKKEELQTKLRTLTGAGSDDRNISSVACTFLELAGLANFDDHRNGTPEDDAPEPKKDTQSQPEESAPPRAHTPPKLAISYTINLNLPATTEIQVFNAIFKSLKEHILNER